MGSLTTYLEAHRAGAIGEAWSFSAPERLLIASRVLLFYVWKIILPINMIFLYPQWPIHPELPSAYWPVMVLVAIGGLLWWRRNKIPFLVWFALGHYAITILPASGIINFYFMRYSFVQNHFSYLAGLGIMMVVSLAGASIIKKALPTSLQSKVSIAVAPLVVMGCGFMSYNQCAIYRSNETLWQNTLAKNPSCWMAYNNLGIVVSAQGRHDEAISYFSKALAIKPDIFEAHNNLGNLYSQKGWMDEAIEEYTRALALHPSHADTHNNLGVAYARRGMTGKALSAYEKALSINPRYAEAHYNLGILYDKMSRLDEAITHYRQAITINPNYAKAHNNLSVAYYFKGDYWLAIDHCDAALRLGHSINPQLLEMLRPHRNAALSTAR